jgi:hypothetical protein
VPATARTSAENADYETFLEALKRRKAAKCYDGVDREFTPAYSSIKTLS